MQRIALFCRADTALLESLTQKAQFREPELES